MVVGLALASILGEGPDQDRDWIGDPGLPALPISVLLRLSVLLRIPLRLPVLSTLLPAVSISSLCCPVARLCRPAHRNVYHTRSPGLHATTDAGLRGEASPSAPQTDPRTAARSAGPRLRPAVARLWAIGPAYAYPVARRSPTGNVLESRRSASFPANSRTDGQPAEVGIPARRTNFLIRPLRQDPASKSILR